MAKQSLADRIAEGVKERKAPHIKRLFKTLEEGLAPHGLEVVLRQGGITIPALYKEVQRIVPGDEENTFSFTNAPASREDRKNLDRARVIEIVETAAITALSNEE